MGNRTSEEMAEARGWVADAFGSEAPDDLTDDEVEAAISRHYDGGWDAFVADCQPIDLSPQPEPRAWGHFRTQGEAEAFAAAWATETGYRMVVTAGVSGGRESWSVSADMSAQLAGLYKGAG